MPPRLCLLALVLLAGCAEREADPVPGARADTEVADSLNRIGAGAAAPSRRLAPGARLGPGGGLAPDGSLEPGAGMAP